MRKIQTYKEFLIESTGPTELKKIMRIAKKYGSAPFAVVAVDTNKNKVLKQEIGIKTYELIPAFYRTMAKEFPNAEIRVEDSTGQGMTESVNEGKSKLSGQAAGDSAEQIADELSYYIEKVIPSNETGYNLKTVLKVKSPKKSVMAVKMLKDIYGIKSRIDTKSFFPTEVIVFDNDQIIK